MGKSKLISRISSYILIAFLIADSIWYGITGHSFASSKYLFFGTIGIGIIFFVFHISYLMQAKKYKDLKLFFLRLIIIVALTYVFGFLIVKL